MKFEIEDAKDNLEKVKMYKEENNDTYFEYYFRKLKNNLEQIERMFFEKDE